MFAALDDTQFGLSQVAYAPGVRQARHAHEYTQITLIVSGGLLETLAGREEQASALSMVIKPAGAEHADRFGPEGAETLMLWMSEALTAELVEAGSRLRKPRWLHGNPLVRPFLRLLRRVRDGDARTPGELGEDVCELLAALDQEGSTSRGEPPRWLARAREAIDDRFAQRPRVADLAAQEQVHPVYLARRFRRHYGCSVTDYIRRRRVREAADLMSRTDITLGEIALRSGFADQPHLCRDFKRTTGLTPLSFRRLADDERRGCIRSIGVRRSSL